MPLPPTTLDWDWSMLNLAATWEVENVECYMVAAPVNPTECVWKPCYSANTVTTKTMADKYTKDVEKSMHPFLWCLITLDPEALLCRECHIPEDLISGPMKQKFYQESTDVPGSQISSPDGSHFCFFNFL